MPSIAWNEVEDAIFDWVLAGSGLSEGEVLWAEQLGPRPEGEFISLDITEEDDVGTDWIANEHNPLVLAADVVESVSAVANTLTLTAHAYITGDGPVRFTTTGTLPAPLLAATNYWLIKASANTIKVATSRATAITSTAIDLTTAGTGTHTISVTADTRRVGQEILQKARGPRTAILTLQCMFADPTGDRRAMAILGSIRTYLRLYTDVLNAAGVGVLDVKRARSAGLQRSGRFEPRAVMEVNLSLSSEVSRPETTIESVEVETVINDPSGNEILDATTIVTH